MAHQVRGARGGNKAVAKVERKSSGPSDQSSGGRRRGKWKNTKPRGTNSPERRTIMDLKEKLHDTEYCKLCRPTRNS